MSVPGSASFATTPKFHSPLLEGLRPLEIDQVLAAATRKHCRAGAVITRQGTPANHFYMLEEGRARYFIDTNKGQKLLMMWIVPGGVIGGGAATRKMLTYAASTEAVRDSTVLCWDRSVMRELLARYPQMLDNALTIAAEYMMWSIETYVGLTSHTAPERLAHILSGLARIIGQPVADGIELDITNEELASAANITLYTASRLLSRWQKLGLTRKGRGRIIVRSPEKLVAQVS